MMPGSPTPPSPSGPPYPYQYPPPPPRRNRTTLVVVLSLAVFVVVAATVTGVYLATAGSDDAGDSGNVTAGAAAEPAVTLPAGCTLLSTDQFTTFVPGDLEEPQETEPENRDDGTTTVSCTWRNIPVYGEVPSATLRVEAYASTTEDVAKQNMTTAIGKCGEKRREVAATTVPGADEACLIHGEQIVETGEFVGSVDVVARQGTVVVKTYFSHGEAMIDEIDMAAETLTSATLATIGKA